MRSKLSVVRALLFSFGAFACDSDASVGTSDTAADDQALVLSVMSARGDTLAAAVEEPPIEDGFADVTIQQSAPRRIRSAPVTIPAAARAVAAAPTVRKQATPTVVPNASTPRVEKPTAPTQSRVVVEEERPAPDPAPKRSNNVRARTGVISSGAPLALFTNQKVCSNGGTFRAVVSQTVRGTNGAVIPAGAQATAEITSVDQWGAGISVRITSVRFDGNSYPVSSRTAYVLPEKGGCIPAQARIEVETKESVRVEALN